MKVKYFATYRDITHRNDEVIAAPENVLDLLTCLCDRYDGFRVKLLTKDGSRVGEETIILVNGRNICHIGGVTTHLKESDTVSVFPVVAGG